MLNVQDATIDDMLEFTTDVVLLQEDAAPLFNHHPHFRTEKNRGIVIASLNPKSLHYLKNDLSLLNVIAASAQQNKIQAPNYIMRAISQKYSMYQANKFLIDSQAPQRFNEHVQRAVRFFEQEMQNVQQDNITSEYLLSMRILASGTQSASQYEEILSETVHDLYEETNRLQENSSPEVFRDAATRIFQNYSDVLSQIDAKKSFQRNHLTWKDSIERYPNQKRETVNKNIQKLFTPTPRDASNVCMYVLQTKQILQNCVSTAKLAPTQPRTSVYDLGLHVRKIQEN